MKKKWILFICLLPAIAFTSCDEKDDIRKDIDNLNARLDALKGDLEPLNTSIKSFQDAMKGLVLITDYSVDEKGNYTLTLSDGKKLVVYSGQPAGEIPALGINEAGNWTYTFHGETKELTDKAGKPCPAVPIDGKDGKAPTLSIDSEGYWCYAIEGEEARRIGGTYNIANVEKIPGGIFSNVTVEGNNMRFDFADGSASIPLLGGLNLTFSNTSEELTSVTVAKESTLAITATPTYVDKVIIDQTPLKIKLTDAPPGNLTIDAKGVAPGEYTVYFRIFSGEGYRLVKSLHVTVSE